MGETLIQLVQDATVELGLPTPTAVIQAADNTARQFGGLAQRCGRLLLRMHDWVDLTREWHITIPTPIALTNVSTSRGNPVISVPSGFTAQLTVGRMGVSGAGIMNSTRLLATDSVHHTVTLDQPPTATATGVTLTFSFDNPTRPTDYERTINRTQWDRSMRWPLRGPQSPQWDQWVRSGIVATGPRRQFRAINGGVRIWPTPVASDAGSQLITEYVSNQWVIDAGGNLKAKFTADADTCIFTDDVMITGIKYLFFSVKGFDTSSLLKQWQEVTNIAIATDGPSPTLDMSLGKWPMFVSPANVPDTGFGNTN